MRAVDNISLQNRQKGAAALFVAVVLLIAVTLVILFSAQVGVVEQRTSANEARHKEAKQLADAALEQAAAFLRKNPALYSGSEPGWSNCAASTALQSTFPCTIKLDGGVTKTYEKVYSTVSGTTISPMAKSPGTSSNADSYLVFTTNASLGNIVTVVGTGTTADGTGKAVAMISYAKVQLVTPGELPPIMAPQLNLNGNFTIVANPNNGKGTTGVPISGWTASNTSGTGTWQTCQLGEYQDSGKVCSDVYTSGDNWSNCACTSDLSNKSKVNYDIYVQSTGFPDPFTYVFGTSDVNQIKDLFKAEGKYYSGDCTGLDTLDLSTLERPWVWVDGNCNVPNIGTATLPVLLVVGGQMTLNSNTDAWGLVVSMTDVKSNGSAIIHGSLIAEGTADIANGGYTQVYDPNVLSALTSDAINIDLSKVTYSWTDLVTN